MQKKLTITVAAEVYEGLHNVIGRGNISQFIENLVRPYVVEEDSAKGYLLMAQDEENEAEALEWIEALIGDAYDETR